MKRFEITSKKGPELKNLDRIIERQTSSQVISCELEPKNLDHQSLPPTICGVDEEMASPVLRPAVKERDNTVLARTQNFPKEIKGKKIVPIQDDPIIFQKRIQRK
ncbi:hypothetical protein TNCV_4146991 [Trichonephila clavipes]|nr:hypothetical protein TNCV_4146991 [Trichonephila clavipes]